MSPRIFYKPLLLLSSLCAANVAIGHTPTPNNEDAITEIEVTGTREGESSLAPNKVLTGNELQNKLQDSLGSTLSNELGVSSSGFGAGAARPVMRGLEGARVQILQNGLSVNDVSSISPDHAVASPTQNIRQIEILRGSSALMYGSGSSGGLINVINDRIATSLPGGVSGEFNTSYESASQGKTASGVLDAEVGSIAMHLDASVSNSNDYQIPGYAEQGGPNANWAITPGNPVNTTAYGKLPFSYNRQNNVGVGLSYIGESGYTGISYEHLNHNYGIPSVEGGFIAQTQNRYDLQHQTNNPFAGISALKFSLSNGDYLHNEFDSNGAPATIWKNNSTEARLALSHEPLLGWTGNLGVQLSTAQLTATDVASGASAIVPQTKTNSNALFWVAESNIGDFKNNLGVRYNYVTQSPNADSTYANPTSNYSPPTLRNREFNLLSYSAGSIWNFHPQYGAGLTYTVSNRAPNAPELFAYGPHDATATFIVGNSNLTTETSHNLELSLQKTAGLLQGKANFYLNKFNNYIYGNYTGASATGEGYNQFPVVVTQQANATIRGMEAELTHNWKQPGVSSRVFTDASWGVFDAGGNLPLQPAPRVGAEVGYQINKWRMNTTLIHAYTQTRLASFEIGPTPSYNLLNASVSYSQKLNHINWTAYLRLTNLLNQDIRYATTPETIRLYAPQMGRSAMIGIKGTF